MQTLVILVLAAVFLTSVLLAKAVRSLSKTELKRRARVNKKSAEAKIYSISAYGEELDLVLWLAGGISFATLLLKASHTGLWLVFVLVILGGWLLLAWRPRRAGGWSWKLASVIASGVAKVLSVLHPVLSRLSVWLAKLWPAGVHTGAYEKEDLAKIIKSQALQKDNRVLDSDLKMAFLALTFGDKTVGQVMTPRGKLKLVAASDTIGPHLMDELHASGFSRFAVVKELTKAASPQIIGTLNLKDLDGRADGGSVNGIMKNEVYYINESQTLHECLSAFLKTHYHLLIVVNDFEEISGAISLEDVLEQILGKKIIDEFDRYDDLNAVASRTT